MLICIGCKILKSRKERISPKPEKTEDLAVEAPKKKDNKSTIENDLSDSKSPINLASPREDTSRITILPEDQNPNVVSDKKAKQVGKKN
jgi:hypothetical protein